jgi:SAM-dependent methyltransferase
LPVADHSLGAAFACHVLHLIRNWQAAGLELVRVLRPGGVFLLDPGGGPRGEWRQIVRRVGEAVVKARPRIGLTSVGDLDALLEARGAVVRELPPVLVRVHRPLADALDELAGQIHAWTWDVPGPAMRAAVEAARPWAEASFGDLHEPRPVETVIRWRAYDWAPA